MRELGCKEALEEPDTGGYWKDGSGPRGDAFNAYAREVRRDDPLLIQVIGELDEKANGGVAELKIVEIPDGIKWVIEDYDGSEHIAEKHRKWY